MKFSFPRPKFFENAHLTIKSKLMLVLILLCAASMLTFGVKSYLDFRNTIAKRLMSKLTTNRNTKLHHIKFYFETIRKQVSVLSQDRAFIEAMDDFRADFHEAGTLQASTDATVRVKEYYSNEFLPRIGGDTAKNFVLDAFLPQTPSAMYLQYHYIAQNPHPVGQKIQLMQATDSSNYTKTHAKFHPMFREFVEKFNYYDMFLIDAETGEVVYSVFKETDFTTNLKTGPNRGSSLAKLFENVSLSKERGYVKITDFLPYEPSYGAPAAFIGSPIFKEGKLIGVLAFQVSVDEITRITTSNQDWKGDGLGVTGETYLVGQDFTMRSQSRFLLEDAKKYIAELKETNVPLNTINKIERLKTSILLQEVRSEATIDAQAGRVDAKFIKDYRGLEVISAYAPLQIADLQWVLMSEMDVSEAFEPVYEYERSLLVWIAVSIIIATIVALVVANTLTRPISDLTYNAQSISEGRMNDLRKVRTGDEFERLSTSFEMMVQSLQAQRELVEVRSKDFEKLLYGVFPEAVARRLENHERNFVETASSVSVIVSDVVGFGKLMHTIGNEKAVEIYKDMLVAFDEAAARHGVEKIKTLGDSYVAAAGLFTPQIDHAIHAVEFANDIRSIVQRVGSERGLSVDLAVGIHTGEVTSYLLGRRTFNFDIIGDTVQIAQDLCEAALERRGGLMISQSIYDLTQGLYEFDSGAPLTASGRLALPTWSLKSSKLAVRE
ncbi:MAG: adenylate/guanylate cyclase domain-containing protein [Candidatus Kapaibacterium sp.]|nr:MAG: adenylate/guanylate cyclase domain-containing protein [Candidatus Kapabacteria bacterium]